MQRIIINSTNGEQTMEDIESNYVPDIEDIKNQKLIELQSLYDATINQGFNSSATGSLILYGYSSADQLNYSKLANVLALNTTKDSVSFGTPNNGLVTLSREQFLQFVSDAESFEMGLYQKKLSLEQEINGETDIQNLNGLVISL